MKKLIQRLYCLLGTINYSKGDMQKAVKWFKKAYGTGRAEPRTVISYAYLLLKQGGVEEAENVLNKMINSGINQEDQLFAKSNLALVLWKKGELEEAIAMLQEVIKSYETSTVYGSLGYLLILKGDIDKALEFNLKAYDYNNSNVVILDNLGQTYYLKGEYDKALEIYEQLMKKNPSFPEAYYNYGMVLKAKNEYKKALENVKKALNYKMSFLSAITREQIELAIEEIEKAL